MYKVTLKNNRIAELFHDEKSQCDIPDDAIEISDEHAAIIAASGFPGGFQYIDGELTEVEAAPIPQVSENIDGKLKIHEMGYFGNVWVRKLYFPTINTRHEGHKHKHDHVSLLTSGAVIVEVEGFEPKEYKAPTFITIDAEKEHTIIATEDDTTWFCVFALRDEDGELTDLYNGDNSPYSHKTEGEDK